MLLSVIICTHNPRPDYFVRVLKGLEQQTLGRDQWELIVVDNASDRPVAIRYPMLWHSNARHVREDVLGLTSARLRGISESSGKLIVFVDDDNVLAADYLEQAVAVSEEFPFLGVWGGSIEPEFESEPPAWVAAHLEKLAVRPVSKDRWSNAPDDWRSTPVGAGMCVRRVVAAEYARCTVSNALGASLGRLGEQGLSGGDDSSIALTALALGMGQGVLARLQLLHLIPKRRLREDYLLKVAEGTHASGVVVELLHDLPLSPLQPTLRFALSCLATLVTRGPRSVRFKLAMRRGRARMLRTVIT